MNNLERFLALAEVPGEFISNVISSEHLEDIHVKGFITSPYTFADFEEHRFYRFVLDDGLNVIPCYCRPTIFPEDYSSDTVFSIQAIFSQTDETSLFCHTIERIGDDA